MNKCIEDWIRYLIRKKRIIDFYDSKAWRQKRLEILRANHFECKRCADAGRYHKADTVHHIKHLRDRPDLAFDDDNLVPLCTSCHWDMHHERKEDSVFTNEERW